MTWRVNGNFHKVLSFGSQINFRFFTNLGNTDKSDQSIIIRVNETSSEDTLKNDAWMTNVRKTHFVS